MIQLKFIPNATQWYKMYTVWGLAIVALLNVLEKNSDAIAALIPPKDLPYWNVGLAVAIGFVRQIHQPAIVPAEATTAAAKRMVVYPKEK